MSRITQKGQGSPFAVVANGLVQTSTDASLATLVGTRWDLSDGREVVLASVASGTTVAAGKLYQDPAEITTHQNMPVTAYQAYSANGNVPAKVTCTLGNTNAVVANQYAGGLLIVNDANGEGQSLRVASHPAAAADASLAVTLEEGATTLITTSSEVSLIPPHGKNVIIAATTVTGAPVGVALSIVAAGSYGWFVTKGAVACLGDGTLQVGSAVSPSNAVAGAVENGVIAQGFCGTCIQTGVDTEYRAVYMNI